MKKTDNKYKKYIMTGAEAVASALALTMSYGNAADAVEPDTSSRLVIRLFKYAVQLQSDLEGMGFVLTVLVVGLAAAYFLTGRALRDRKVPCSRGIAGALAFLYTGSVAFEQAGSLSILFSPVFNLLKTAVLAVGMYFVFLQAVRLLYVLAADFGKDDPAEKPAARDFLKCWLILLILWLPHIILRYPGIMGPDNYNELADYYGLQTFTNAQPVFHAWLLGTMTAIGVKTGSANLGLFLMVFVQYLCGTAVLAASLGTMKKLGAPEWLRITAGILYGFVPVYTGYAAYPIKDVLFSYMFLWQIMCLMEWIRDPEGAWKQKGTLISWVIGGTLMILVRKNGIYIYAVELLFLAVWHIVHAVRTKKYGRYVLFAALGILLPVIISSGAKAAINSAYDVQNDSVKEAMSLPFQQTARFARDHGDLITDDEYEVLNSMLHMSDVPAAYDELNADPVKKLCRNVDTDTVVRYIGVWLKEFTKAPVCYIEATWNQFYGLFLPEEDLAVYELNAENGAYQVCDGKVTEYAKFKVPASMEGWCDIMQRLYYAVGNLPVLGMLSSVGFYILLMIVLCVWTVHSHSSLRSLILPVVLGASFVFIILGPAIIGNPRYAFPLIYAAPTVTAFTIREVRSKDNEDKKI